MLVVMRMLGERASAVCLPLGYVLASDFRNAPWLRGDGRYGLHGLDWTSDAPSPARHFSGLRPGFARNQPRRVLLASGRVVVASLGTCPFGENWGLAA